MNNSIQTAASEPPKKDRRYKFVASLWRTGEMKTFYDIFDIVPRSTVAADLGINYERFTRKVFEPEGFSFREIYRLSFLLDIPFDDRSRLVAVTIQKNRE
ncbi:hypothetical protein [Dinghuibacter silviterrae]|uniref:Uncharacterized protein n=1 Tax=Dinghuibacter silviterrae TaxID=1539049 RepID=A0A4R8DXN6_9BACT|nr:hypothetical protein [Dinghuibacter silviterrae]TDX02197.1 hypothetical protein EDB95_3248 [Dinghuibacter silviterrae]